jgi:minor extracellular serine protease Vpr
VAVDLGAVLTGSFNGQVGSFVFDLVNGGAVFNGPLFASPTDSSTLLIQLTASQLGLTPAAGNFEYTAVSFSLEGAGVDPMKGKAGFNPFTPALTNFPFEGVAPNGTASDTVAIDPVAFDVQKMLGVMVLTHDNASGAGEAQLIRAPGRSR